RERRGSRRSRSRAWWVRVRGLRWSCGSPRERRDAGERVARAVVRGWLAAGESFVVRDEDELVAALPGESAQRADARQWSRHRRAGGERLVPATGRGRRSCELAGAAGESSWRRRQRPDDVGGVRED